MEQCFELQLRHILCFVLKFIPVIQYIDSSVLLSDGADEVFFFFKFVTFLPGGVSVMYIST